VIYGRKLNDTSDLPGMEAFPEDARVDFYCPSDPHHHIIYRDVSDSVMATGRVVLSEAKKRDPRETQWLAGCARCDEERYECD
jgi:hypothetical protein